MNAKPDLEQLDMSVQQLTSVVAELEKQCPVAEQAVPESAPLGCPITRCNDSNPSTRLCAVNTPVQSPFVPDYDIPLLAPGGGDTKPDILAKLGPLAGLIGTWVSQRFSGFNVMPIPQVTAPNGFILKNHSYYEVITFSAIQGKVANRSGEYEQDAYTLFYEQRVFFADGPQADELVHAENGSWLHQVTAPQGQNSLNTRPFIPTPPAPNPIPAQNPLTAIVKQVSVPHGNSILALGGASKIFGAPKIPVANCLPLDAPKAFNVAYGVDDAKNPNINPNAVLNVALLELAAKGVQVSNTTTLTVDSCNKGAIANTPFMKKHSDVSAFSTTYWLEQLSTGQLQLQYTQDITLDLPIGGKKYKFPHITANTLTKVQ
ncbi:heme-binding protein [Shewanella abyssi]|uniref:heme-binding protein n=1 Tax=Shewanella abyssi TaxID=311789 RepID=UPI00201060E6|nr:heme-binding protein [Shewanella abyssi]MCL1048371.1 heme-binding protein [Shewanella abyssi]